MNTPQGLSNISPSSDAAVPSFGSNADEIPEYIDTAAVAARLANSVRTLEGWRRRGAHLAFYRIGRRIMYRVSDVEAFISASRVNARSSAS